jgi:hypothetical protein
MRKPNPIVPFACSLLVSSLLFLLANVLTPHRCDDCMIQVGRPFAYKITSNGWGTPEKFLWRGAFEDALLVAVFSMLVYAAWNLLFRRKSR